MRCVILCLLSCAPLLGGCAASDKMFESMAGLTHPIVDKLPEWAGGPPQGLPPKPTDPRYAAYKHQIETGETPAASVPAAEPLAPLH
jgi:hypothetical protein